MELLVLLCDICTQIFFIFEFIYLEEKKKKSLLPFLTIKSASTSGSDSDLSKLSIDLKLLRIFNSDENNGDQESNPNENDTINK